jgi:hypothetical protein
LQIELFQFFLLGFQKSYPRPNFGKGQFFGRKNVDNLYSRTVQQETIANLVGSSELALKYIEKTGDVNIHLAFSRLS